MAEATSSETGCTFNSTITDASFLPPPQGKLVSCSRSIPMLTTSAVWFLFASLIAMGAWASRQRSG